MKTRSPGKLILSGEHAVVHGAPALAMAVNRFASAEFSPLKESRIEICVEDELDLCFTFDELSRHLELVRARHLLFLRHETSIREVLPTAADFLLAVAAMAEPREGCRIVLHSEIPLGSGMGSSAAIALALLRGLLTAAPEEVLQGKALAAEQLQHGRSSGLDVAVSLRGGMIHGTSGRFKGIDLPLPFPFRVFHSGVPASSTGECVTEATRRQHGHTAVWQDFAECTQQVVSALKTGNEQDWTNAIRRNHRLLQSLGVVPCAVAEVIARAESRGGAGKICGAGSIRGDAAGLVLITGADGMPVPQSWKELDLALYPGEGPTLPLSTQM